MIDNFEPQLNHKTVQVTRGLFLTLRKENGISAESSFQRMLHQIIHLTARIPLKVHFRFGKMYNHFQFNVSVLKVLYVFFKVLV